MREPSSSSKLNVLSAKETIEIPQMNHRHYIHRSQWLRASVLGMNDGLVSTSSLMLGITAGLMNEDTLKQTVLGGLAGLVSGALSMAVGEFVSVYSQKDVEQADIKREKAAHLESPNSSRLEEQELAAIYVQKGLSVELAKQVAHELHQKDLNEIVKIHARDELGIDVEQLANPLQASVASAISFAIGASLPLLAGGFIHNAVYRIISIVIVASVGLVLSGTSSAILGGSPVLKATLRVVLGGWIAMGVTFGIGFAFGVAGA
jgi:vacuolar iron transporter family protein